jgi:hypothetical protein
VELLLVKVEVGHIPVVVLNGQLLGILVLPVPRGVNHRLVNDVRREVNMKVQLYSEKINAVGWREDGYVNLEDGVLSLEGVTSQRSRYRAQVYLDENIDNEDKEAFLQQLSSVFFVPFCRFGDIIEDSDNNEKEEEDETEGIPDEDDTEETE